MLKYGRNAKNDVLRFYESQRPQPILGIFIFIMGVSPSNFIVVSFLLKSFYEKTIFYVNDSDATDFDGGNCSVVGS